LEPVPPDRSMKMDVNMVLVPVTVTDTRDRPVTGLDKKNFSLYQDGEPQEIRYFSTEDAPVSIGLLLDVSKSMRGKFGIERAAISEFFKNANAKDDYFVVTFSDHANLAADTTQSIDSIQASLASQTPDGNTALFDAISMAVERMHTAQYHRKALLIISDGGDNHSRHHLKEIRRLVQDSDVDIYAIGIFDSGFFKTMEESMGKSWLNKIASATGGQMIALAAPSMAPEAAETISREMREHYVLGYWPTRPSGTQTRRKIRVRVIPAEESTAWHTYYKTGYIPTAPDNTVAARIR
jgi:Ca-activated chloride channel family protein